MRRTQRLIVALFEERRPGEMRLVGRTRDQQVAAHVHGALLRELGRAGEGRSELRVITDSRER